MQLTLVPNELIRFFVNIIPMHSELSRILATIYKACGKDMETISNLVFDLSILKKLHVEGIT